MARRGASTDERKKDRPCATCGRSFRTMEGRYCSYPCTPNARRVPYAKLARLAATAQRVREMEAVHQARLAARRLALTRLCAMCGKTFHAENGRQRFCDRRCRWRSQNPAHGPFHAECVVCHEAYESRRPNARYCSNTCRRHAGRKAPGEHARRRGRERVRRLRPRIIERWGMRCYLCLGAIAIGPESSHPGALTLDHVVPIAQGGRDTEDNLRPAHRGCNVDKGERYPAWWERRQAGWAS